MGEMHNTMSGGSPPRMSMGASVGSVMGAGIPNLEEEMSIDKNTLETIKQLHAAKERAVEMENFDEAKRLKETIEKLKMIST